MTLMSDTFMSYEPCPGKNVQIADGMLLAAAGIGSIHAELRSI